jgi:hypothetical protein
LLSWQYPSIQFISSYPFSKSTVLLRNTLLFCPVMARFSLVIVGVSVRREVAPVFVNIGLIEFKRWNLPVVLPTVSYRHVRCRKRWGTERAGQRNPCIFLPLAFITGFYGINFAYMPELAWRWSYPIEFPDFIDQIDTIFKI